MADSIPAGDPAPNNSQQGQGPDIQGGSQQTTPVPNAAQQAITTAGVTIPNFINSIGDPPTANAKENISDAAGRRVRLRPKPGTAVAQTYGSAGGLMTPLLATNGMIFPYQPTITYQQEVNYQTMEMVHTNQDFHVYQRTPALKLQVEGEFTVQSSKEGQYALACIHFLRTVTKMYFGGQTGATAGLSGTPPPVLLFDAYGTYMFNALPVIVTSFTVGLPKDVDYVPVLFNGSSSLSQNPASVASATFDNINSTSLQGNDGYAWLPAIFSMTVNLVVQNTPARLKAFDLDQFRTGALLTKGTWV